MEGLLGPRPTKKNPDLSLFCNAESLISAFVKDHFKTGDAKMISNLIQNERGYIETPEKSIIPYRLATDLGI